jgi:hypothetical protein
VLLKIETVAANKIFTETIKIENVNFLKILGLKTIFCI